MSKSSPSIPDRRLARVNTAAENGDALPPAAPGPQSILDGMLQGVVSIDKAWRITSFNAAAAALTGVSAGEAIGKPCWKVFRSNMCGTDCAMRRTMTRQRPAYDHAAQLTTADGQRIAVAVSTSVLRDDAGQLTGGIKVFGERKASEDSAPRELPRARAIGRITTCSDRMVRILDTLPRVAESEATVLIHGETGTGKELLAHSLHELSDRCHGPFVPVNCGALPDTLMESELCGYEAGAFTGAVRNKPGLIQAAAGGTLFLDEICHTSAALQVVMLRVLESRTYQPVGATRARPADVRIVAASNCNLAERVAAGEFLESLYYRLAVMPIDLPPLRERKADIPLLVDAFIADLNAVRRKKVCGITAGALAVLAAHDFPGNIRELRNIVEHAFVLSDSGGLIEPWTLPASLRTVAAPSARTCIRATLHSLEARTIADALVRHGYRRSAVARELGMHRTTLYRKMKAFGIPAQADRD